MYSSTIYTNGYTVDFDYHYQGGELRLLEWFSYIESEYIPVVCEVESNYIENKIREWLDKDLDNNITNYDQDELDSLDDQYYDDMEVLC